MMFGGPCLHIRSLCILGLLLAALQATAAESFRIRDIRVEGLQRLPVERVFGELTLREGDRMDEQAAAQIVRRLFATGDFEDVQVGRDGDVLVIVVAERPSIARIELEGNTSIGEGDLRKGLKDAGLAEGEVFRRATLEGISAELERQYVAQGRYGAQVKTEVIPLPRNRVGLRITIYEGSPARIRDINIVGNTVFTDEELLKQFELSATGFWSFIKGDDKYARERLAGDLERLSSYYMDRGYVNFAIESTQVSVTPDRREVFISINVAEGKRYRVGRVRLAGNLVVEEDQLRPLVVMREGQVFSQQLMTYTTELLTRRLGNEGYTFADIQGFPEINEDDETVDVTFYIEPGQKVYVRRVSFRGNVKTEDEVLRRELRQFERAPANSALIDLSRQRLQRLGFFSTVEADTRRVPGAEDLVDVEYKVEEQPSGSIGANIGYSDASGLIFGASVSQSNFMGSGNRVSFSLNRSELREYYAFSHYNPYYTLDGVSRGFNVFYSNTDYDEASVASYAADRAGASVTFGYPISEYSRLSFGIGVDSLDITYTDVVAEDIWAFIQTHGDSFRSLKLTGSFQTSTLNRGILPDRGWSQQIGLEVAAPGSDYLFYKVTWAGQRFFPLARNWTLRTRADLGFGDGYGDDYVLPFFENFYSGGIGSVRGYEARSLGVRSPSRWYAGKPEGDPDPDPMGGNLLVEGSLELIFPTPFAPDSRNVRTFLFADAGNVFQTEVEGNLLEFDTSELRYAVGVGITWLTAIGPLSFNLARPVGDKPGDETEAFQFSLGQVF